MDPWSPIAKARKTLALIRDYAAHGLLRDGADHEDALHHLDLIRFRGARCGRRQGAPLLIPFDTRSSAIPGNEMTRNLAVVLYVATMIAVVVSMDLLFFRNRFWERLMVNIGIVLVFAAFYFRFLKNP
jgi:hypothetical protein